MTQDKTGGPAFPRPALASDPALRREDVEQIAQAYDTPSMPDPLYLPNLTAATLRALSAKLEAAEAERDAALGVLRDLGFDNAMSLYHAARQKGGEG